MEDGKIVKDFGLTTMKYVNKDLMRIFPVFR